MVHFLLQAIDLKYLNSDCQRTVSFSHSCSLTPRSLKWKFWCLTFTKENFFKEEQGKNNDCSIIHFLYSRRQE